MAFAITKSCCTDASCVSVCPVGCIHPAPGEPGFGTSEILHIDPHTCIDCGACADACPVQAIFPVDKLSAADQVYADINANYDATSESLLGGRPGHYPNLPPTPDGLSIAVIGSGPAGMYTVRELLARTDASITLIDALPTPGGLLRSGVAPDHQETKGIQRIFDIALRHPRVTFVGGVRVGSSVHLNDIRSSFDAVFLATGARTPRRLGVPGEEHSDVVSALDIVRWAGGEPGADSTPSPHLDPLTRTSKRPSSRRAVIVGTGNVALDLVRLFTLPPAHLARTDIADRALHVLQERPIQDVVVLGRGPADKAAYTEAEYRALCEVPDLEIRVVDEAALVRRLGWESPNHPRVTFVFGSEVEEFKDEDGSLSVQVKRTAVGEFFTWSAELAVTSIGYVAAPVEGTTAVTEGQNSGPLHTAGRLPDLPGVYLVGWAKRGAIGGIGANRLCAAETVDSFLDDVAHLPRAPRTGKDFLRRLHQQGIRTVDRRGSTRINLAETRTGQRVGRPRIKLTDLEALHQTAKRRIGAR